MTWRWNAGVSLKGASSGNDVSGNLAGVQADGSCVIGWNPQNSHHAEGKHDMALECGCHLAGWDAGFSS